MIPLVTDENRVAITDEEWQRLVEANAGRDRSKEQPTISRYREIFKEYGGEPLPNVHELTMAGFSHSPFFTECWEGQLYRQHMIDPLNPPTEKEKRGFGSGIVVRGFWFRDGQWVALSHDYWKGTVRFWAGYVCAHQYRELPKKWDCYHESICVKCGHYDAYDSSG